MQKSVREQIWAVDNQQPVGAGFALSDLVDDQLASRRTQADVLGAFAGLALLLAGLGIYAVISFAVTQRTQEIGIRMALGAQPANVVRMVLGEGVQDNVHRNCHWVGERTGIGANGGTFALWNCSERSADVRYGARDSRSRRIARVLDSCAASNARGSL